MKLGEPLWRADVVDSTMNWARERLAAGQALPGAVFLAREQSAGRGRHGREWTSPTGKGLYLTAVLPLALSNPAVTLAAALATAEAAERQCGIVARIKWPNDLLHEDRKWGGVLAEVVSGAGPPAALLGIGVNVNQDLADFPAALASTATSLTLAAGTEVDGEVLLAEILARLAEWLDAFERGGFSALAAAYGRHAAFAAGDRLELDLPGGRREVTFREIDARGRLVLEELPEPLASGVVLRVRRRERT